jgi:hypothetical protein
VNENSISYYAIYWYDDQGPSMGSLYCSDSNDWSYITSDTRYPNIGIPSQFTIENFEVFQVIKQ